MDPSWFGRGSFSLVLLLEYVDYISCLLSQQVNRIFKSFFIMAGSVEVPGKGGDFFPRLEMWLKSLYQIAVMRSRHSIFVFL